MLNLKKVYWDLSQCEDDHDFTIIENIMEEYQSVLEQLQSTSGSDKTLTRYKDQLKKILVNYPPFLLGDEGVAECEK